MKNEIDIYIKDTIRLANTISVKSTITSTVMNDRLSIIYGSQNIDTDDKKTWKYYLNISGQYHFSDTKMYITSLDTLETILFSVENLSKHTLTRENYQFGTRYYYSLLEQYPEQETLIKGILYPCDIQTAIDAVDGTILSYQKDLVEEQEATLIPELSEWCKRYQARWRVDAYIHRDTLYPAAQIGVMYLNMVGRIIALRLKRCKTNEAHSFHIKAYLGSHNKLHEFIPYYTLKQKLWLYRNISYIQHNSGSRSNFNLLVDKILTDRAIPLAEFNIEHKDNFIDGYTDYSIVRKNINSYSATPDNQEFTLSEIYEKENPLLSENPEYNNNVYKEVHKCISNSPSSRVKTKLLESHMLDYTNSEKYSLPNTLINHWPYMAAIGLFDAKVNIVDPATNEPLLLSAEDAFIFYFLLTIKKHDLGEIERIPPWLCCRVLIPQLPTDDDLISVSLNNTYTKQEVQSLLNRVPFLSRCRTSIQFINLIKKIYNHDNTEWFKASNIGDLWQNTSYVNMVNRTRQDIWVEFSSTGKLVKDWMSEKHITTLDYSKLELDYLLKTLLESSSGYQELDELNVAKIQSAMISTIERLSSYSIQIVKEINEEEILVLYWRAPRVACLDGRSFIYNDNGKEVVIGTTSENNILDRSDTRCLGLQGYCYDYITIDNKDLINNISYDTSRYDINICLPNMTKITSEHTPMYHVRHRTYAYISDKPKDAEQGIENISNYIPRPAY